MRKLRLVEHDNETTCAISESSSRSVLGGDCGTGEMAQSLCPAASRREVGRGRSHHDTVPPLARVLDCPACATIESRSRLFHHEHSGDDFPRTARRRAHQARHTHFAGLLAASDGRQSKLPSRPASLCARARREEEASKPTGDVAARRETAQALIERMKKTKTHFIIATRQTAPAQRRCRVESAHDRRARASCEPSGTTQRPWRARRCRGSRSSETGPDGRRRRAGRCT